MSFSNGKSENNIYLTPDFNIVEQSANVKDLGIYMSDDCSFSSHIFHASNIGKRLSGWILRAFTYRDPSPMLLLFKSIVLPRIEYGSQLWRPHLRKDILALENPKVSIQSI